MAETATNPIDSTELVVETPINIDTLIYMLNPDDLPMLGGVNSDGFPIMSRKPVDNTVFFWLEDEFLVPRCDLAEDLTDSETDVDVTPGSGERFAAGDAILIDNELMFISGVTNDTLTVTRGQGGTSNVVHSTGAEVIGVGTVLAEGSIGDEQFTGRTKKSNYTQIWTSKISITRTARAIPKYGMPGGELPRQTRKIVLAEGVNMEQAALYGVKYQSGNVRATGGLSAFITSNVYDNAASGDHLTVNEIQRAQQDAYNEGGMFTHVIANAPNFEALNNLAGNERIRTVEITDSRRGRVRATVVVTEFGETMLSRNRYLKRTDAFGVNPSGLTYRVFQPWIMQPLAKTDDKDNFMFVAEGGFQVKGERHMCRWTGLDASGAMPADLV